MPFVWKEHEVPHDYRRLSSYGINALLSDHGFSVKKIKKSCNGVELLFQFWTSYIWVEICKGTNNRSVRIVFQRLIIFPTVVAGILLSNILPPNHLIYADNIVLRKKK